MPAGNHLRVRRGWRYWHHGIDVGDGFVVHLNGSPSVQELADVIEGSWQYFSHGDDVEVVQHFDAPFSPAEVVERARSCIGALKGTYVLRTNNCEHFAEWCSTGQSKSRQIDAILNGIKGGGLIGLRGGLGGAPVGAVVGGAVGFASILRRGGPETLAPELPCPHCGAKGEHQRPMRHYAICQKCGRSHVCCTS